MKGNRKRQTRKVWNSLPLLWTSIIAVLIVAVIMLFERSTEAADVVVYKSPTCNCCAKWVRHMKQAGFTVEVRNRSNINPIKTESGVPQSLQSCHTALVGDYVVEGHVPAGDIERLLAERPNALGLAVPDMPIGSPGMEVGNQRDAFDTLLLLRDGSTEVFERHL